MPSDDDEGVCVSCWERFDKAELNVDYICAACDTELEEATP